jgi:hypothetical protein
MHRNRRQRDEVREQMSLASISEWPGGARGG